MREDRNVVRDAMSDHAAKDRVVAPHAELDLNGRDWRDGGGLFDLADGHVHRPIASISPSRLSSSSARTLVASGVRGSGACNW